MVTTYEIQNAKNTAELDGLVEEAAFERNCELGSSSSYKESADWFEEDGMWELANILRAAETRWFELEQ